MKHFMYHFTEITALFVVLLTVVLQDKDIHVVQLNFVSVLSFVFQLCVLYYIGGLHFAGLKRPNHVILTWSS